MSAGLILDREVVFTARGITKVYRMGEIDVLALRGVDFVSMSFSISRIPQRDARHSGTPIESWSALSCGMVKTWSRYRPARCFATRSNGRLSGRRGSRAAHTRRRRSSDRSGS